ncbi:hypothetical protein D9M71_531190 [compost metagenome]
MFSVLKAKRDGLIMCTHSCATSNGHWVATTKCSVPLAGSYQPLPLSGSSAAGSMDGVL